MPVNLSIKNTPDDIVAGLRRRAARHHRSLQGELLSIVEAAVRADQPASPEQMLGEIERLGVKTPAEATMIVRAARDAR